METKVAAIAPAPDPKEPKVKPTVPAAPSGEAPAVRAQDPVEMRLVIEMDQATGSYVYKTVNRLTGEVVRQLPRAEVLRLKEGQYTAGSVIKTKA
jgi:flagellar protein FlaG